MAVVLILHFLHEHVVHHYGSSAHSPLSTWACCAPLRQWCSFSSLYMSMLCTIMAVVLILVSLHEHVVHHYGSGAHSPLSTWACCAPLRQWCSFSSLYMSMLCTITAVVLILLSLHEHVVHHYGSSAHSPLSIWACCAPLRQWCSFSSLYMSMLCTITAVVLILLSLHEHVVHHYGSGAHSPLSTWAWCAPLWQWCSFSSLYMSMLCTITTVVLILLSLHEHVVHHYGSGAHSPLSTWACCAPLRQ